MGSLILFAIVLMAVGMLIAYIGDRLGTFVGKKRISKFGLRPRHTAILYTTITGGIIPLLTLALLINIDRNFERAIVEGNQLVAQNKLYKSQAEHSKHDAVVYLGQKTDAEAGMRAAQDKLVVYTRQMGEFQAKTALSRARFEKEQAKSLRKIAEDQRALAANELALTSAKGDLDSAKRDLASAKAARHTTAASLKIFQQRVADAQQAVAGLGHERDRLNLDCKTLIGINEDLKLRKKQLETANVYHTGDEVGRTVVYTSETTDQIRVRLTNWLESLSRTAAHRGAAQGNNGRDIVVEGDGSEKQDESIPEDASLDTLADHIAQQASTVGSVVVVANVRFNSTVGEQVRLDLQSFDNLLVFSKGDSVASTVIDGSQPQQEVMNQLVHFVSQKVQHVAIDKAIMPTIDPSTLNRSYGQADHLLDTVAKIQEVGGSAEVVAVASDDVFTNGPLTVHLDVVPPPSASTTPDAHTLDTAVRDAAPSVKGRESFTGHSGGHRNPAAAVTGL